MVQSPSQPPGVPHHQDEVDVTVYGRTHATVVVDKLVFGHLSIRGQGSQHEWVHGEPRPSTVSIRDVSETEQRIS